MTRDDIITAARDCLGTPFVHQGRIPGRALDCAGLVVAVAQAWWRGIRRPDRLQPQSIRWAARNCARRSTRRHRIAPSDVAPPAMCLLMRFSGDPQHLAILAGGTIIHAWEAPGLVCEHDLTDLWVRRIVRVYRFQGAGMSTAGQAIGGCRRGRRVHARRFRARCTARNSA